MGKPGICYDKWNNLVSKGQMLHDSIYMKVSKRTKLTESGSRMVVARDSLRRKSGVLNIWAECQQCKMNKFYRSVYNKLPVDNNTALYISPPLSVRNTLQDPQWMTENTDNTEPYIYS